MFKIFATPTRSYFQAQVLPHASKPVSDTVMSVQKLGLLPFQSLSHIDLCPQCFHGNTKPFPNISMHSLGKLSRSQSTHPWASSFVPFPILMQVCLHPMQMCLYPIQVCLPAPCPNAGVSPPSVSVSPPHCRCVSTQCRYFST